MYAKEIDVKELSVHVGIAVVLGLLVVYVSRNKLAEGLNQCIHLIMPQIKQKMRKRLNLQVKIQNTWN